MINNTLIVLLSSATPAPGTGLSSAWIPADQPEERTDPDSRWAHQQLLAKTRQGRIDVYFLGDSLTRRWGASDHPHLLAHWKETFHGWNAANFGWGGDKTQNLLWRLIHGEMDGLSPKIVSLQVGTNNLEAPVDERQVEEIARGVEAVLNLCREKAPGAVVVLTGVFIRNDNLSFVPAITELNRKISRLADGNRVRWVDINHQLGDEDGILKPGMANPEDKLHLELAGYEAWAAALQPIFTELLGPPATADLAPPPTGKPGPRR